MSASSMQLCLKSKYAETRVTQVYKSRSIRKISQVSILSLRLFSSSFLLRGTHAFLIVYFLDNFSISLLKAERYAREKS